MTPSQHRTRLGPTPQQQSRVNLNDYRAVNGLGQGNASRPIEIDRSGVNGYGMSAGMKIGRQPGKSQLNSWYSQTIFDDRIKVNRFTTSDVSANSTSNKPDFMPYMQMSR